MGRISSSSAFALIVFGLSFFTNISIAQSLFEVERESFCRRVENYEPVIPFSGVAEMKKGEGLFLWMEIKAGERALTMLEAKGEMPVYHAWASEIGVVDLINIGIRPYEREVAGTGRCDQKRSQTAGFLHMADSEL